MLSKKIDTLKRAAKSLAKSSGITHSAALDQIAVQNGYQNWSVLMKNVAGSKPASPPPTVDEMVDWFRANHTPAIEESPYATSEGGYLWPLVDEFTGVQEILRDQFPSAKDSDIEKADDQLQDHGPWIDPGFMKLQNAEASEA